jgi:hypothetical protein
MSATWDEFERLQLRVGVITDVEDFPEARDRLRARDRHQAFERPGDALRRKITCSVVRSCACWGSA